MTSRWGVCNIKNHNVTLNLELSKYPKVYLNYVIVHELSHFIHPNHSKEFWLLVSKYCPNYKDIKEKVCAQIYNDTETKNSLFYYNYYIY